MSRSFVLWAKANNVAHALISWAWNEEGAAASDWESYAPLVMFLNHLETVAFEASSDTLALYNIKSRRCLGERKDRDRSR